MVNREAEDLVTALAVLMFLLVVMAALGVVAVTKWRSENTDRDLGRLYAEVCATASDPAECVITLEQNR